MALGKTHTQKQLILPIVVIRVISITDELTVLFYECFSFPLNKKKYYIGCLQRQELRKQGT